MHTRRLAAFFLGAWLLGCLFIDLVVKPQSVGQIDRIIQTPPTQVAKDMEELGAEVTRQLLRYSAWESRRAVENTWGIVQTGLIAALLSAVMLTPHRSRLMSILSISLTAMTLITAFYITPAMEHLGRTFDFIPATANSPDRDSYNTFAIWYNVLEVLKVGGGIVLAARLLFDRMGWKQRMTGKASTPSSGRRRRKKRISDGSVVEPVNHPDDSHVNG